MSKVPYNDKKYIKLFLRCEFSQWTFNYFFTWRTTGEDIPECNAEWCFVATLLWTGEWPTDLYRLETMGHDPRRRGLTRDEADIVGPTTLSRGWPNRIGS